MCDRNGLLAGARATSRVFVVAITLIAAANAAQGQPSIRHDEVRCVPRDQFTQFVAQILPTDQLRSVRLYFRSDLYPEYYFVDMSENEARYSAVLPLPTDQTRRVVYYIEVVDQTFQITRSEEFVVSVEDQSCNPGPGALFVAGNPGIIVGAVSAGAPSIPAGFQATGIVGFVSATGAAAAGAGGLGVGLGVGAAAGAAAGVGVLVGGGDDTGNVGDATSPTVTTSPTVATGAGPTGAGPTSPPVGDDASSSTTTTSTAPQGPEPPPAAPPTTSVPPPPLSACFNWHADSACVVSFESCSGPLELIVRHDWRVLGPPVSAPVPSPESNTRSFSYDFAGDPRCEGDVDFNRPVRLTVTDSLGRSAQIQQSVSVRPAAALTTLTSGKSIVIRSNLAAEPPDGSVRGQIIVDGKALPVVTNQGPLELRTQVAGEGVLVEAILQSRAAPGTHWEFELSGDRGSTFGYVAPESGTAIQVGDTRIVFRLEGREGERIRFRARSR